MMFPVEVEWLGGAGPQLDGPVVFHGINKSGSLCMAKVLRDAYFEAGRSRQYFSHYHQAPERLEDLIRIIESSREHCFSVGHSLYGAIGTTKAPATIITQFRHPLPRVLSCYQWLKNKQLRNGPDASFPTIEEFVVRSRGVSHSQITQFGCGFGPHNRRLRALPVKEIFEMAKENIEKDVSHIGIAEYFEESVFLFSSVCGLPAVPAWQQDKRNKGRISSAELPASVRDLIHEVYSYDFQLYEWALQRFFEQLNGVRFGDGLDAYKSACLGEYKDRILATPCPAV